MKGAARARRPTNKRRGRVAPAELARLLKHPDAHAAELAECGLHTPKQIERAKRRLPALHKALYGDVAIPLTSAPDGTFDPSVVGGFIRGTCCSHWWAAAAWHRGDPYPPQPDPGVPPTMPPAQLSFRLAGTRPDPIARAMARCPRCCAHVPASYFAGGVCWDCHHEADEGRSIGSQRSSSLIDHHQLREERRRN